MLHNGLVHDVLARDPRVSILLCSCFEHPDDTAHATPSFPSRPSCSGAVLACSPSAFCACIKRVACDDLAAHQPVKEGAHRTGVGLDSPLGSRPAMLASCLAQVGKPGADVGGVHLCNERDAALFLQERLQQAKRGVVPIQRFPARVAALVVLQVIVNHAGQGGRRTTPGLHRRVFGLLI